MKTPILRVRDDKGNEIPIPAIRGKQGVGIKNIERTAGDGSPGSTDVYTVTLTDGTWYEFSVYNGEDGDGTHAKDTNNPHKVTAAQVGAAPRNGLGTLPDESDVVDHVGANGWYLLNANYTYTNIPEDYVGWGVLSIMDKTAMLYQLNTGIVYFSSHIGYSPVPWVKLYSEVNPPSPEEVGALNNYPAYTTNANNELTTDSGRISIKKYNSTTKNTPYAQNLSTYTEGLIITYPYSADFSTQICIPAGHGGVFVRSVSAGVVSAWGRHPVVHRSTLAPTASDGGDGDIWYQYV